MFDEQKSSEYELSGELTALERQLRGLTPVMPRIDRDRLMFAAGRVAEEGPIRIATTSRIAGAGRWLWPAATACMTAATLLLATMLVWQSRLQLVARQKEAKPQAVVDVVSALREGEVNPAYLVTSRDGWSTSGPPTDTYLGVRYIALTHGVSALPAEAPWGGVDRDGSNDRPPTKPVTARNLLDELLPSFSRSIPSRS